MTEIQSTKRYDLEERTFQFAKRTRVFLREANGRFVGEDQKQLLRSSGSVGANYIEANEALGKKDFLLHIRIARKEAKETAYWLNLLFVSEEFQKEKDVLLQEAHELMNIFGAILRKSE